MMSQLNDEQASKVAEMTESVRYREYVLFDDTEQVTLDGEFCVKDLKCLLKVFEYLNHKSK